MNSQVSFLKRSSLFLLFLFSFSLLKAQTSQQQKVIDTAKIKCIYQLQYQPDSTNNKLLRSESMLLLIGHSISKFQSLNSYLFDSVKRNVKKPIMLMASMQNYRTNFLYKVYKNYPRGKVSYTERILRDYFLVEQPMNLFDWKITQDTATISGYHCQKATTHFAGRDYEAWFSFEVPVDDGPYKFNGLPGLIVKIGDTHQQYVFSLISLQQLRTPVPIYFSEKNYIKTTQKKFEKAKQTFFEDFKGRLAQTGITIHLSDKEIKKRFKKNSNNAIEIGN